MTAAVDHRAKAVELNAKAYHYVYGDGADPVVGAAFAQMAQVHATLALADTVQTAARFNVVSRQAGAW